MYLLYFRPSTRVIFGCLSAARFAGMTTTRLPFNDFNGIIAKDEVELFMERHGD
jgi:hypothetical protein